MNIKLLILISLIVPAVIGGFWRRRRRRSHKPNRSGTVTGSIRCNGGSIRSCTGSIHGEKKWGKNTSLGGHVTCGGGGCGGGITFTHRFKRDAKETGKFHITINLDVCKFNSYDINENNKIEKEEITLLFGEDVLSDGLFEVLDVNGDGFVFEDEFVTRAPDHIETCSTSEITPA